MISVIHKHLIGFVMISVIHKHLIGFVMISVIYINTVRKLLHYPIYGYKNEVSSALPWLHDIHPNREGVYLLRGKCKNLLLYMIAVRTLLL